MKFNVAIVANNADWASWPQKVQAIKDFFASRVELNIVVVKTYNKLPFILSPDFPPLYEVDRNWYGNNVSIMADDIVMLVVTPESHVGEVTPFGLMTGHSVKPWECTLYGNENDHAYVQGVDLGNSLVLYACHELSHVFYAMMNATDNTHKYFYAGTPKDVLADFDFDSYIAKLRQIIATLTALISVKKQVIQIMDNTSGTPPIQNVPTPTPVPGVIPKYLWDTPFNVRHSLRVICDEEGLTVEEKNELCATVQCESQGFQVHITHPNIAKDGSVASTDYGLCQVNDYWHIGPGKDFPSKEYVLNNPEADVRWMCKLWKTGEKGKRLWECYKQGLYLKYMPH